MDKITIFIIVLFWIISAIFKAIQKSGRKEGKYPFSFPPIPKDRVPPQMQKPLVFEKEAEKSRIQIEDFFDLVAPPKERKRKVPPGKVLLKVPSEPTPVSLEELFIRSANQIPLALPTSQPSLGTTPKFVQKESDKAVISKPTVNLERMISEKELFEGEKFLSPWQRAVVLHEILQPPKSLRNKKRRFAAFYK